MLRVVHWVVVLLGDVVGVVDLRLEPEHDSVELIAFKVVFSCLLIHDQMHHERWIRYHQHFLFYLIGISVELNIRNQKWNIKCVSSLCESENDLRSCLHVLADIVQIYESTDGLLDLAWLVLCFESSEFWIAKLVRAVLDCHLNTSQLALYLAVARARCSTEDEVVRL